MAATEIENVGGGVNNKGVNKTITAMFIDVLTMSVMAMHLDLSVGAFKALTSRTLYPPRAINTH
jgi:hypothetical protein